MGMCIDNIFYGNVELRILHKLCLDIDENAMISLKNNVRKKIQKPNIRVYIYIYI